MATAMSDRTEVETVASAVEQLAEALGVNPEGVTVEVEQELGSTVIDGADLMEKVGEAPKGASEEEQDEVPKGTSEDTDEVGDDEQHSCSGCGKTFSSEAGVNGHQPHCDGEAVEDEDPLGSSNTTVEDGDTITEGDAKSACKGLGESLQDLMERSPASFRGKVGSGISDADDRATLYRFRFGTCNHKGCNQGTYSQSDDYCRQHQDDSEQSSEGTTEGGDSGQSPEGEMSKADFVSKLMNEGLSALEAAEKAESVYGN